MALYRNASKDSAKIAALKAAGNLYGLDAPVRVAETNVAGEDKNVQREAVKGLSKEQLRALRDAERQMEAIAGSQEENPNERKPERAKVTATAGTQLSGWDLRTRES